ncbi:alpha/beta hydrolase [Bacillus sp. FJAT-49736]|uniref:intracellular short-chain-length polyhydroxyalkanoate depolymerase n=1 Tax=Bacillus sp. FJAT-49736 TaxID=2833582 RepID=UPI001BC9B37C|nr:alpha/beta hydrolase [Bacillus sp. FJAT-49736]MBS4171999.1 alpha/beta hydrolase [Bacillus sp. FJAT-49736]
MTVVRKKVELPNGETLSYREREGGNQVVLLIHGNMTSSKHWDVLMEKMDPSYKLIAVDLRGFGDSTYQKRITGIKDFSDDVKLFVDTLGFRNFTIMGWSTGGAVGMQYVADHPDDCQKLVLLASASTRGFPFYAKKQDGSPDLERRLTTIEDVEQDPATIAVQGAYDHNNREFLKTLWNTLIYTHNQPEPALYEEYVDDMRTQRNLADVYQALNTFNISSVHNGIVEGTGQAKNISIPILILRGERDYVVSALMTEEIIEDIGENGRFVELKDCGHSPLLDNLGLLIGIVEEFLQE